MTTFRSAVEDLEGLIRERQRAVVGRCWRFPAGAAVAGLMFTALDARLAALALGAAAAWSYSAVQEYRAVRSAFLWDCAWLLEDVTVDVDDSGLRLSSARGTSLMRWDGGVTIHPRDDYFVVKDETDELAVLPKKYLSEAELLVLNAHATQR